MEDDFEETINKEVYKGDVKALASQIKEHEALLNLKRRWLMGLPLKDAEEKRVEELLSADRNMPESLLREDDVSYENIKTSIEMGFGAHKREQELFIAQEEVLIFESRDDYRDLLLLLDGMTNKGLCSFANILTGGMVKFDKTNLSMKRTIKEHLGKFIREKSGSCEMKLKQLSQLVNDPNSFHETLPTVPTICEAYCDAANKVLDGLEDLCPITLHAMSRKIKGVKGFIPALGPRKPQMTHKQIEHLRNDCKKMLLDPGRGGEPAEQLGAALGVAGLALTHLLDRPVAVNFRIFSPEVKALQSDVAKAIWLLDCHHAKRVRSIELKLVQALLDPNFKVTARSFRSTYRNMLTEFLFECSDMEEVPDSLIKTLDIINGKLLQYHKKKSSTETHLSPQYRVKEEMQEEVEHVLAVSAQAKEVLLEWFPGHEFNEDFAEVYMEDFEESDVHFTYDDEQNSEFETLDSQSQTSSFGETSPDKLNSHFSMSEADSSRVRSPDGPLNAPLESTHINEMDLDLSSGSNHSHSVKESEIQSGQRMDTEQNSVLRTVKTEVVYPDPFEDKFTKSVALSSSFARTLNKRDCKKEEPTGFSTDSPRFEASDFCYEQKNVDCHQNTSCNAYLEIQEACDSTSMIAYRFVGRMLDELAKIDGIELYQGDRLYLQGGASVTEDSEESSEALLTSRFPEMWKNVRES